VFFYKVYELYYLIRLEIIRTENAANNTIGVETSFSDSIFNRLSMAS
jgi:hypothetical protein